jgi:hypothetical protein
MGHKNSSGFRQRRAANSTTNGGVHPAAASNSRDQRLLAVAPGLAGLALALGAIVYFLVREEFNHRPAFMDSWPALTVATLSLNKSDFGHKVWSKGQPTFESVGRQEQKRWMDSLDANKEKLDTFAAAIEEEALEFFNDCREHFPEFVKYNQRKPGREKCGWALSKALAGKGKVEEAAASYRMVAAYVPLPPDKERWIPGRVLGGEAQKRIAMYLRTYLIFLWRAARQQSDPLKQALFMEAYNATFASVAREMFPWTDPLQLASLTIPGIEPASGAAPFWDKTQFTLTKTLEERANFLTMREELVAHLGQSSGSRNFTEMDTDDQSLIRAGDDWTKLVLYSQINREWNHELCGGPFRQTCAILREMAEVTAVLGAATHATNMAENDAHPCPTIPRAEVGCPIVLARGRARRLGSTCAKGGTAGGRTRRGRYFQGTLRHCTSTCDVRCGLTGAYEYRVLSSARTPAWSLTQETTTSD